MHENKWINTIEGNCSMARVTNWPDWAEDEFLANQFAPISSLGQTLVRVLVIVCFVLQPVIFEFQDILKHTSTPSGQKITLKTTKGQMSLIYLYTCMF